MSRIHNTAEKEDTLLEGCTALYTDGEGNSCTFNFFLTKGTYSCFVIYNLSQNKKYYMPLTKRAENVKKLPLRISGG
jgi:hypothetical protein